MSQVNEENIEDQRPAEPCSGLRKELKECILASDCVKKHGLKPNNCLDATAEGVDENCRKVQYAFFECKRSLLDFRTRFRGRKGY
ncbi:PREDICTED: cytochrome c oxidase assembly factor 5-like [Acropora digitifera]|uniref:cytochrome c oxidase assembly factor 5-like n=1 Tax=Acropora digitifera TaxID=70779 RepID=UPI00077AB0E7|nr:PREDICTED: cytochrome c oxidase assembly factor 5-like [Acropora digitifera]